MKHKLSLLLEASLAHMTFDALNYQPDLFACHLSCSLIDDEDRSFKPPTTPILHGCALFFCSLITFKAVVLNVSIT